VHGPRRWGRTWRRRAEGTLPAGSTIDRDVTIGTFDAVALVGTTASGKTGLSLEVAKRLPVEIISMDSRQVFRGMNVGTAKATPAERAMVPHHGLDVADPRHRFNAGEFSRLARNAIPEIRARGHLPFLVGGTGFFLRALTHPIFREPEIDTDRRSRLQAFLETFATEELHRWLHRLDPMTGERLRHWGGRQRLLRALEMPLLTGRPLSWWHAHAPPEFPPLAILTFVLDVPREQVDAAIDRRVDGMVAAGLVDEVRGLLEGGLDERAPGLRAHGYQELLPHLRGEIPLEQALDDVRRATRAYARRQVTWFRNQLPEAVRLDGTRPRGELADEIARRVREHLAT